MVMSIDEIKKDLKIKLKKNRYKHTLGVVETCLELNNLYNLNINEEKLVLTALLHDCAKDLENEYFEQYKEIYSLEKKKVFKYPVLSHAFLGSIVAKERYGVEDEEILEAIRCHTTGKKKMNNLEKTLCLADYIEPNRDHKGVNKVRKKLDKGLDYALLLSMDATIKHLLESNAIINIRTIKARNYLQRRINEQT